MRKKYTRVQYNDKGQKQCTNCERYKDISDFHKYAKAQDGLKPWCKHCVREYDLKEDDPKRVMPRKLQGKKIHCRRCERYLDKTHFWGDKETYCKECKKFVGINSNLKNKKLDIEKYSEIEKSQNGVCKICGGKDNKRLSVDHDHSCCSGSKTCGNCTRGLLCSRCNKTLGMIQDDPELLQKMINYLTIYPQDI
jgi:hypothetical protein